jgi:thymidylate synthase
VEKAGKARKNKGTPHALRDTRRLKSAIILKKMKQYTIIGLGGLKNTLINMAKIDHTYQELCKKIFAEGREYENKNRGVKRLQIPSFTLRHSFDDGFPALTNKKLYWKGIVGELIWFLRGDNDVKYLNDNGITIWNKDALNWEKKHNPSSTLKLEDVKEGSVGQNYSVQWRNFNRKTDQIADLILGMKKDIMSSRLKVNAWNPSEIFETALPPCHSELQVIGVPLDDGRFGFELHWNQRSVDVFLGLPFNIASYGLLAKILEHLTGYKALGIEGTLKCVHFYDNQYEAALELLKRSPDHHKDCQLNILAERMNGLGEREQYPSSMKTFLNDLFNTWKIADFILDGYTSDKSIKVDMLAPKEI